MMKNMKLTLLGALGALALAVEADVTKVEKLSDDLWRVRISRDGAFDEGRLNRYGVVERLPVRETLSDLSSLPIAPKATLLDKGWELRLPLAAEERVYGLGDASRQCLNRRGGAYDVWVANVTCYIPVPMVMTSRGWGVFVNTPYRSRFDVGKSEPDAIKVTAAEGPLDFYVFSGRDYRALLEVYTRLTGRPALLPAFAFGFAYVANQWIDQFEVVEEAWRFRSLDLPCDIIGLEPGWMEYFYDFTTKKTWNSARFSFPPWTESHAVSWIGALERMDFKLSLWLCCNYDLFVFEEACAEGKAKPSSAKPHSANDNTMPNVWQDEHIQGKFSESDRVLPDLRTVSNDAKNAKRRPVMRPDGKSGADESGEEPWFDHLKKFVDRGARCFKLDGSMQVDAAKDRPFAGGRISASEGHNIYPVVYAKQMAEGYEAYTGRRAMVYSSGGYAGLQRYIATWAGDTGGEEGALVSVLNLGLSGQPNQTCDMSIFDVRSLHFGFLSPWTQQNNWDYFQQPWYQSAEGLATFRSYLKLRYSLFPYLYLTAATASRTGWPIMRPLAFAYPDCAEYANETGTYMLGDSLLVASFSDNVKIPSGDWHEWRTDEKVSGPRTLPLKTSASWGGALYVKAGSVIPMWPKCDSIRRGWNESVELHVWPGASGRCSWYEDDGDSLAYRRGEQATTELTYENGELTISPRRGSFAGMPTSRHIIVVVHGQGKPRRIDLGSIPANAEKQIRL